MKLSYSVGFHWHRSATFNHRKTGLNGRWPLRGVFFQVVDEVRGCTKV